MEPQSFVNLTQLYTPVISTPGRQEQENQFSWTTPSVGSQAGYWRLFLKASEGHLRPGSVGTCLLWKEEKCYGTHGQSCHTGLHPSKKAREHQWSRRWKREQTLQKGADFRRKDPGEGAEEHGSHDQALSWEGTRKGQGIYVRDNVMGP